MTPFGVQFIQPSLRDLLDIVVISLVLYRIYVLIRGAGAMNVLIGLLLLGVFYLLADLLGLYLTSWLFQYLWAILVLIIVIVFQPEIRRLLERASPASLLFGRLPTLTPTTVSEISSALFELASERTGALVVLTRKDDLRSHIHTQTEIDAKVTAGLILSIFHKSSPLHDGAAVISQDRIKGVRALLPLSASPDLPGHYGSRHRAAVGITELTDAISLVVSEERGEVSLFVGGTIRAMAGMRELENELLELVGPPRRPGKLSLVWESLRRDLRPLLGAVALASLLWLLIAAQRETEIALSVPLRYLDVPKTARIVGGIEGNVTVRVRGPERLMSSSTLQRVEAWVDLKDLPAKTVSNPRRLAVRASAPPGLQVVEIEPPEVRVWLEPLNRGEQ